MTTLPHATASFPAMGSDCSISVYLDEASPGNLAADLAALGRDRMEMLHRKWTRFDPGSEVSQLNAQAGHGPVHLSDDTWLLVTRMRDSWLATEGAYDPTVHGTLMRLGYDRTRDAISWNASPVEPSAVPGMQHIGLDSRHRTATLPEGVALDPGGIGKGLAGDIIAEELTYAGAVGVLVDAGGDLVAQGQPGNPKWRIGLPGHPHHRYSPWATPPQQLLLPAHPLEKFAVGTSGLRARQWGPHRYHIVDPRSGLPADSPIVEATLIARAGWLAEGHTKATLIAGRSAPDYMARHGLHGIVHWADGTTYATISIEEPDQNLAGVC